MRQFFYPLYAGAKYRSFKQSSLYENPQSSGLNLHVYIIKSGRTVTLTGYGYEVNSSYYYLQTLENNNLYICIDYDDLEWERVSEGSTKEYSQAQAQDLIGKLLKNNQYIFENNLLLSRFANKLSYNEKVRLYNLQKRLENRDNMLRESDVFSQMQESRIMGYSNFQDSLNSFMGSFNPSQSVGLVVSTTWAIITAVVVIGSLSTAAYFAFKDLYEESVQDVKLSREMLKIFEKYNMTEEDIATIQQETQGIVTKAVLMEKIRTTFGNIKNILLYGALGYVGYQLYKKYKK